MRQTLILLFIFSLISCSSSKVNNKEINEIIVKTNFNDLKIAKISRVINSDTINFNELRFHNIDSALDTMKSMFLDFGSWNNKANGLHQKNIQRKVWENIKLFENDERFTIIADGTETVNEYYACLIVFDSQGKDCFDENHPLKNKLINYFHERMKENRKKEINYLDLR
ncbi:hypothetical protein J4050_14750 [Winogradskyella sp. DF17]|uniref:Lipoprotein n=1 Tax=Winogradskyella pelagia TaxID=2819984 RepID=A0ABS3T6T0_9FLAO|nr:hypothetical protein [Winogradskyella sp. DF17]MBO3118014.1 hypothetical protein [Winogradskyella sp. DF17]